MLEINIKQSINTDTINEDFRMFDEPDTGLLVNTGIERNGGITNLYETKETYPEAGDYIITTDGKKISLVDSATADYKIVKVEGVAIGQVSAYGVSHDLTITDCDDIFLTDTGYVTCLLSDSTITIKEYDLTQTLLHTRSVTFTNIASVLSLYTSLSFVKYYGQVYTDSQEWALRLGDQVVILQESVPGITVTQTIMSTTVLGGSLIRAAIVYKGTLVVAGDLGRVGSFDGAAWKIYDGTGQGTGLFQIGDSESVLGTYSIVSLCVYGNILVFAGQTGKIGSYNGFSWVTYTSSTGIANNTGYICGNDDIVGMAVVSGYLIFCGSAGRIGSWSGTAWTAYSNATAGAVCDNRTLLGTNVLQTCCTYNNQTLIVGGSFGVIGSMSISGTVATKSIYTTVSTVLRPTNNGTVIGNSTINAMIVFNGVLVIAGALGRLGSFLNTNTWVNYTTGTGISDNGTIIGSDDITSMGIYHNWLVIGSNTGRIGCIYSDGTKHAYASGLLYSDNGAMTVNNYIRTINALSISTTKDILLFSSYGINSIDVNGIKTYFYSGPYGNLLEGFQNNNYLYVYRYENGQYLINLVGNDNNKSFILNNSTRNLSIFICAYALVQVSNGYSRHIITAKDTSTSRLYDATRIFGQAVIGYILAWEGIYTFADNPQWDFVPLALSSILLTNASWGYIDFTFKQTNSTTNIFNFISQLKRDPVGFISPDIFQGNTNTLINAYGKLTNNIDVRPVKPFEFRVNVVNNISSYFSVALLDDIQSDALGVIITNIGAINDVYQPEIHTDDTMLYQNDQGIFKIKKISETLSSHVQKITDTEYKINTISPLNIIDTETNTLEIGSVDFNNRMLFSSLVTPTTSTKIASFIQGKYSNSIDTGDKLVTIVNPTSSNIQVIGYRIPIVSTSVSDYEVDTYINDLYSYSTINSGAELVDPKKVDTIYVASTFLPVAIGSEYINGTVQGDNTTIFLKPTYDGYSIGNDIAGIFTIFQLFGQTYLFDGKYIYSATIDEVTGIFINKSVLAPAVGMQYIASSPTIIYFYSNFDNSIYTFTGGRSLEKFKRFNAMPKINRGIYSVVDNTVLFDTDTSFIWIRDSIISENQKAVDQTSLKYYDTTEGLFIGNNVSNWQYTYETKLNSTVLPLTLRTPFYGFNTNMKSVLSKWCITLYNPLKPAMMVRGTCYTIDEDVSREQVVTWNINPADYNNGGYVRIRLQPQMQKTLGISLKIETDEKVLIVAIYPEFKESESAVTTAARSR